MNAGLFVLLTFLAVALAIIGIYSIFSDLFLRDRSRVSQRVDEEFRRKQRERAQRSALFKNFAPVGGGADESSESSLRRRFEAMIEQSGLDVTPRRVVLLAVTIGLGFGAIAWLIRGHVLVALLAAVVGAALPLLFVQYKRKLRLNKLLGQLPDAFDLMARVIRAGQTLSQGMQAVADEFDQPISGEFAYCYEQQNLGLPPETTLRDLAERTGVIEIKIFVLAVLVQQQTGGNLAELLDKLSTVVRERFRIRGKIRALTAEGRIQAAVLLGLPAALFLIMMILHRRFAEVLLDYPGLLVGVIVSELFGALWIRKIINFDY